MRHFRSIRRKMRDAFIAFVAFGTAILLTMILPSARLSPSFSAKYVAALRRRNRIYLAIIIVKAFAILIISLTHGGLSCPT